LISTHVIFFQRNLGQDVKLKLMSEILDIVNDNDEVIGQAERDEVHRIGLVCRLAYVCFYTAGGEVILQKRSDTN
jgi:isopentenyldiphosphate isomerase